MSKSQVCAKGFPNRFRNGREKCEQTDKQTDRHFRIYISRDNNFTNKLNNTETTDDSAKINNYYYTIKYKISIMTENN